MEENTCKDCSNNCLACESATKCDKCENTFELDFEEKCIQCPSGDDLFFDKFDSKTCKSCKDLDEEAFLKEITADGKLSEVKINLPTKPYRISYPLAIKYESPDSRLMCIKFQVKENIVRVESKKSVLASNPSENEHIVT